MPIRGTFLLPSTVTKTLVCIDTIQPAEFRGRFYNIYLPNYVEFNGAFDLVNKMDHIFDDFRFPHAYFDCRSFHPSGSEPSGAALPKKPACYQDETIFTQEKGEKVTLLLQVVTRQHATWQGMAFCVEKGYSVSFQSIRELMHFILDSFSASDSKLKLANWGKKSR